MLGSSYIVARVPVLQFCIYVRTHVGTHRKVLWHCLWVSPGLPEMSVTPALHPQGASTSDIHPSVPGLRASDRRQLESLGLWALAHVVIKNLFLCVSHRKKSQAVRILEAWV